MNTSGDVLKTKAKIVHLADIVRRKYLALKLGRIETDESLKRMFKPVSEPLEKLVGQMTQASLPLPNKIEQITQTSPSLPNKVITPVKYTKTTDTSFEQPKKKFRSQSVFADLDVNPDPEEEVFSHEPEAVADDADDVFNTTATARAQFQEMRRKSLPAVELYLESYPEIARAYIEGFLADTKNEYDTTYGLHINSVTNKVMLGSKELQIGEKDDIIIGDRKFPGTRGLYELIFKRKPNEKLIKSNDEDNYSSILKLTSAHKRDYHPSRQVKGAATLKYKKYIQPTLSKPRSGQGYMVNSATAPQFVYYDDPNELVDRLRLLIASGLAGNDAHRNEIESIIEELRERGYIY